MNTKLIDLNMETKDFIKSINDQYDNYVEKEILRYIDKLNNAFNNPSKEQKFSVCYPIKIEYPDKKEITLLSSENEIIKTNISDNNLFCKSQVFSSAKIYPPNSKKKYSIKNEYQTKNNIKILTTYNKIIDANIEIYNFLFDKRKAYSSLEIYTPCTIRIYYDMHFNRLYIENG
jgi:hypothetical protein